MLVCYTAGLAPYIVLLPPAQQFITLADIQCTTHHNNYPTVRGPAVRKEGLEYKCSGRALPRLSGHNSVPREGCFRPRPAIDRLLDPQRSVG